MRDIDKLALAGGRPAVHQDTVVPRWPQTSRQDELAVIEALRNGDMTSLSAGGAVERLEAAWADWNGARHCIAVSNGTAALTLALAALDIGEGDEVIVPALSFVATAIAPVHINAVPVFADIDPVTFNLDPTVLDGLLTPRTKAIIVVHLHGLPADMTEIAAFAERHDLLVIEDAAQAHGATYKGQRVGTLADVGVFSLNASKNLPTCGEGGLIVTDDERVAERLRSLRQFGERLKRGEKRGYLHEDYGWNNKLNGVNAAYTLSQLSRFEAADAQRSSNVEAFLDRLRGLPGLIVPRTSVDRSHAWHILRFRLDAAGAGLRELSNRSFRLAAQRALNAEGVRVEPYQQRPLPAQPVFASAQRGAMSRLGREMCHRPFSAAEYPVATSVIEESFTIQRFHLNSEAGPFLQACADGFDKVFRSHLDQVGRIAQATEARGA